MLRYCFTAAGLGVGWFVVLMIPDVTRQWLLADVRGNLLCLAAASVLVAVGCRSFIERAETFSQHLVRAAVVPYLGCVIFLSLWAGLFWARSLLGGGLANLHDMLSLYAMGMVAAVVSCFVVVPYGLLCQYVMNAASSERG
jgi:hypothetical protein